MSTFDSMAASIDWLDAYRAASLSVVDFYASDAVVECSCGGIKVISGRSAITAYWIRRFVVAPAGELIELQPDGDGMILISYVAGRRTNLRGLRHDSARLFCSCSPTSVKKVVRVMRGTSCDIMLYGWHGLARLDMIVALSNSPRRRSH